jgi:TonB family protein
MIVKSLAVAAAVAIAALSVRAFAEPSTTTVTAPQVAMVGSNLAVHTPRKLINKTALEWPETVAPNREVKVVLRYTVEADGSVDHIETVFAPANPAFAQAAEKAIEGWSYAPAASATDNVEAIAYFHGRR